MTTPSQTAGSLDPQLQAMVLAATGAEAIAGAQTVQSLWSGYGRILRCRLAGGPLTSAIVKHVHWPNAVDHPHGWTSDLSHERKVRSYEVESTWYARYAARCESNCRVPRCVAQHQRGDEVFLVLEDLDTAGFPQRCRDLEATRVHLQSCLRWLAHFHATFMNEAPEGLWPVGTYWHLATRPEELEALDDEALKAAAPAVARKLEDTPFRTFVHGDAKLANFCFSESGDDVAAVDFQYVGGGCGMKDVAYFVSSCLGEDDAERMEAWVLDTYFRALEQALIRTGKAIDFEALHGSWRALYPVAWTDFYRFLQGWSPGHWKNHRYSRRLAREVLEAL